MIIRSSFVKIRAYPGPGFFISEEGGKRSGLVSQQIRVDATKAGGSTICRVGVGVERNVSFL